MAETAEQYLQRLASYIEDKDPLLIQKQTAAKLSALIAGLSMHELIFRPGAGKWSIVEILAHLAEDEMATAWRYRQMIERDGVALAGFDQELWAKLGTYRAWDHNEAVELFRLLREANLRMLGSLSREQWERSGEHAERGRLTVADLARHMAAHDINHLQQVERLLPGRRQPEALVQEEASKSPVSGDKTLEFSMGLALEEIAELLQRMPVVLRQLILALPEQSLGYHRSQGKWCVKEVVGHLTEEDRRDFVGRIELMLREPEPRLNVNDQVQVAEQRHDCDKDIYELLEEFAATRNASAGFVKQLSLADLDRSGVHPRIGLIHVRELLHEWVYHDLNHVKQIEENIQSFLWNQLGNMQAFYAAPSGVKLSD